MALIKKNPTDEVVIYNFDIGKQEMSLLYRGTEIPREFRDYQKLWRLTDRNRRIETIIISI
jgi:hypothetical protein